MKEEIVELHQSFVRQYEMFAPEDRGLVQAIVENAFYKGRLHQVTKD